MEPILEAKKLNLWYGPNHALHDVSIAIPEHEITAFIGPSGCGKSTLLKTFNRMNDLIPATRLEGEIRIDGHNIERSIRIFCKNLRIKRKITVDLTQIIDAKIKHNSSIWLFGKRGAKLIDALVHKPVVTFPDFSYIRAGIRIIGILHGFLHADRSGISDKKKVMTGRGDNMVRSVCGIR